ncbi:MAG: restriction endonuclease subunit S [Paludibacter sp.]|nr:restriction endonuclease subunit S [Muribaculum sp.]MCM1481592.1 restriction endonuclease subunit S [Paludibacter sp.]MCM1577015.1 restriction endonuclease subunit S [Bacteroides sp.]
MNKIQQLLATLCPNGVEYKPLGEVCEFKRGNSITEATAVCGDIPVIAGGQQPAYYHNVFNRNGETIVISGSGAYAGFVSYWTQPIFVSDAFSIAAKDNCMIPKYLYYYLKHIQNAIHATKRGSGTPHVRPASIADFPIPVPPLVIQEEIVKILDKFSLLSAELEAELESRKKQYDYYRNRLLSFDSSSLPTNLRNTSENEAKIEKGYYPFSITWKKLGEVATLSRGRVISKNDLCEHEGQFPVYSSQTANDGEFGKINTYDYDGEYLTWTTDGAYAGTVFRRYGKFSITNVCGLIDITDATLNKDFLYYWLNMKAKEYVYQGMGNPKLMSNQMVNMPIPIPPIEVQNEIVRVLDKFETLVTDLSAGLPAEIALVQQQYEYYRNKLLTF